MMMVNILLSSGYTVGRGMNILATQLQLIIRCLELVFSNENIEIDESEKNKQIFIAKLLEL